MNETRKNPAHRDPTVTRRRRWRTRAEVRLSGSEPLLGRSKLATAELAMAEVATVGWVLVWASQETSHSDAVPGLGRRIEGFTACV